MSAYLPSLLGGMLIGASAVMLVLLNGRIAGISGIVGRLAQGIGLRTNLAFVLGLLLGPLAYLLLFGGWPVVQITASWPLLIVAGLLVGFGSRMGSGCTSGHGVLGLARLSIRSMVAVATFLTAGAVASQFCEVLGYEQEHLPIRRGACLGRCLRLRTVLVRYAEPRPYTGLPRRLRRLGSEPRIRSWRCSCGRGHRHAGDEADAASSL